MGISSRKTKEQGQCRDQLCPFQPGVKNSVQSQVSSESETVLGGVPARTKHPKRITKLKEQNLPSFQESAELFITAKIKSKASEAADDLVGKLFALQV